MTVLFLVFFMAVSARQAMAGPLDQNIFGLPEGLYHKDISDNLVQEVRDLFPERTEVNPSFVDPMLDPNLHIQQDAIVSLTFIDEGAGYWNSFGYFLYDENETVLEEHILFGNASELGEGGFLIPGDTIDIGLSYNEDNSANSLPAGTNMGFFVESNGWGNPVYSSATNYKFYTLDNLNPDGKRHVAMVYSQESQAIIVGIEDVWYNYSDKDFNDILFTFTTDPADALIEIVNEGNIPQSEPVPEPATMLLFGTGLMVLAESCLRKRSRVKA